MNARADVREKRITPRVRLQCPLRYRMIPVSEAGFHYARAEDLSPTGFRFHSQEFVPKRAGFLMELVLPGSGLVRTLARAVWVRVLPEDDGYEIGGRFVEPPHEARAALAKFVSAQPPSAGQGGGLAAASWPPEPRRAMRP